MNTQFNNEAIQGLKQNILNNGANKIFGFSSKGNTIIAFTDAGEAHIKVTGATASDVRKLSEALNRSID